MTGRYQYTEFGRVKASDTLASGGASTSSLIRQDFKLQTHAFTLGVAYRF